MAIQLTISYGQCQWLCWLLLSISCNCFIFLSDENCLKTCPFFFFGHKQSSQTSKFNLASVLLVNIFTTQFHLKSVIFWWLISKTFLGSYCNDCRDLDLSRDSALLTQEWRCAVPQCGQPYDTEVMENSLLQIVRQRERLYHLQDLKCLRCKQVKAAHLAEQCACAGSFRCKEEVSEFNSKMQIFLKTAVSQKFELLQECTSWILGLR